MKKFFLSFALLLGLMCVAPQSALASDDTLDNTEVVVTYNRQLKLTIITVYSNGEPVSTTIRDANGKIIYNS